MLRQQGLAPPLGEQLGQTLQHQREPSQQAQGVPGAATWPRPCRLRGAIPRLVDYLSATNASHVDLGLGGVAYKSGRHPPEC